MTPSSAIIIRKPADSGTVGAPEWRWHSREFIRAKHHDSRPQTVENVHRAHDHMARFLGESRKLISGGVGKPEVFAEFVQHMFATCGSMEFARTNCFLNVTLVRWLMNSGKVDRDFTALVQIPRGYNTKVKAPFTTGEVTQLIEFSKTWKGGVWTWPVVLASETTASFADACLMKWASWNPKTLMLTFGRLKMRGRGRPQSVPVMAGGLLHQMIKEKALEPRSDAPPNDPKNGVYFMSPTLAQRYMTRRKSMVREFRDFLDASVVGVGKSFHSFRSGTISRLIEAGVPPTMVCRISGHSAMPQLNTYYRESHESMHEHLRAANILSAGNGGVTVNREVL